MARPTKFDLFEEELVKRITNKTYSSSQALPSEHNLCKEFNLSRSTVRKALNKVKERGLITSVGGKGYFVVGASPFDDIQNSTQVGLIIGINFADWSLTHLPCLLYTLLEENLAARNKQLMHIQPDRFGDLQSLLLHIESFPGDTILVHWVVLDHFNNIYLINKFLQQINKKIIIFDFESPGEFITADLVYPDWESAVEDAVNMLIEKGLSKIVYAGYDNLDWSKYRKNAFLLAMRKAGLWDFGQDEPYISYSGEIERNQMGRALMVNDRAKAAKNIVAYLKQHDEVEAIIYGNDKLIKETAEYYDISKLKANVGFDNDFWTREQNISSIAINLGALSDAILKMIDTNSKTPRQIAIPSILMKR